MGGMAYGDPGPTLQGGNPAPVPGGIADLLAGAGAGDAQDAQPPAPADPLEAIQHVLEQFPPLLVALHDAGDVDQAVAAMRLLTGIQKRQMQSASGAGSQGR